MYLLGSGSLLSFVYTACGVGLLYLDLLSLLTQILKYIQVNVRSLAQRRKFSLLSQLSLWKWEISDVKQPHVGITTKEAFSGVMYLSYYNKQPCYKLKLRLKLKY